MANKFGERSLVEELALLDKWIDELSEHAANTLREAAEAGHSDKRWVDIAKTHFEQGLMALRRSVHNHGRTL